MFQTTHQKLEKNQNLSDFFIVFDYICLKILVGRCNEKKTDTEADRLEKQARPQAAHPPGSPAGGKDLHPGGVRSQSLQELYQGKSGPGNGCDQFPQGQYQPY
jgi:hypothetical protein